MRSAAWLTAWLSKAESMVIRRMAEVAGMASKKHEQTEANSIPWQRCLVCLGRDCGLHGGHSKHSEVCAMPGRLHHMHLHLTRSLAMSTCGNKTQSMTHIWQIQYADEHALISIGVNFRLTHELDMLPNNHRCEQPKNIYPARVFCLKSLSLSPYYECKHYRASTMNPSNLKISMRTPWDCHTWGGSGGQKISFSQFEQGMPHD